jgi:hypothetical protein
VYGWLVRISGGMECMAISGTICLISTFLRARFGFLGEGDFGFFWFGLEVRVCVYQRRERKMRCMEEKEEREKGIA